MFIKYCMYYVPTVPLGKIKSPGGAPDFHNTFLTAQKPVKNSENITT